LRSACVPLRLSFVFQWRCAFHASRWPVAAKLKTSP
jgi:hypothetical protein